jgi:hypothetical protein
MKTHSKSTGEFVDLARESVPPHAHTLSLSLSLHRQIDFAITFKLVRRRVKYSKNNPKHFHKLSRCYEKATTLLTAV